MFARACPLRIGVTPGVLLRNGLLDPDIAAAAGGASNCRRMIGGRGNPGHRQDQPISVGVIFVAKVSPGYRLGQRKKMRWCLMNHSPSIFTQSSS